MYLFNTSIGKPQNNNSTSWSHLVDERDNHFISRDDILQRIRIDKTVDIDTFPQAGQLEAEWQDINSSRYNILPKTRWVNNNKNMNPLLLVDSEAGSHGEQVVVYITVSMEKYKLVRYRTNHRILQTFHKKDEYQGAVVVFNTDDLKDSKGAVAQLQLFNKKLKKYEQVNITINTESYELAVNSYVISDKKQIELLKDYEKKLRGRIVGFKIITKPNDLLTSLYITTKELRREVEDLTKDIKNAQIIEISDSFADGKSASEKDIESAKAYLKQRFAEKRIRALTCYGINLPREIVRELRLLYVFKYNTEVKILSCKKSN